jgi:drug/metabolite transporter (DMT)-like permease
MTLAMIAWGETWVSAKILNMFLESKELVFWRFLFTASGLILVLFYFKLSLKISLKNLFLATICALILTFYNISFFLGTKYGLASLGGVLVTTLTPINTFLLINLLKRKKFTFNEISALIVGVVGALIILKIWKFNLNSMLLDGNLYYLYASLLWPFLTIISSKQKNINPLVFTFYIFFLTAFFNLIYLKFHITNIFNFNSKFWINLLLLSLYGTTFATTVYFIGVKKLGSKIASSFFFLVPVSSIIFAVIFLNEKIQITLILGGILTIFAVYKLNKQKA